MKQFLRYILTLVVILMTTTPAWAATYYAKAIAYSSPENCGYVWVTINNSSFNESQFSQKVMDSSDNDKYVVAWENHATFTAKYYAKPIEGYKFIGWYDENGAVKSTSTNNNCYHSFSFDATSKDKNNRTTVYRYAYFVKYNPSVTTIDFGELAYNSGIKTQTFTINCHNVGTWNTKQTIEQGPFTITFSNRKNDDTEHIVTANVALKTTSSGNYEENLSIKTTKGGTITIKLKANINATPTYTWNPNYWNADGTQKRAVHVDDIINNVVSSTSKGAITYSYELTNPSNNNNGAIHDSKFENNTITCGKAGLLKITINQAAEQGGYNAGSDTRTILIEKYDITPKINPDNAVWNQLVTPNPFSASTQHKFSGATSLVTDFTVTQQNNEHIAKLNNANYNIQTYYTNGDVNFLIKRTEDYKYNALNQTLTLHVNQSGATCTISVSPTSVTTGGGDNSTSGIVTLDGAGDLLSYNYKLNNTANVKHYLTTQYSTSDNGDDFLDIAGSTVGEEDETLLFHSLTLPPGTKRIRFKRTDDGWGDKKFEISDITVTRKQYLSITLPEVNNDTLFLPTVAINQPSTDTFNLAWSACSDSILLVCDNSKFTIQPSVIQNADRSGNQTITVSCDSSKLGTFTGKIFIYDQAQKDSIYVSCTINRKWTPIFSGTKAYNMQVDSTLTADFTYKDTYPGYPSEDPQAPFYYTIKHILDPNNHVQKAAYANKVITYDPITKQITAHNAGTAILALIQREIEPMADADGYFTDTLFCTITVSKRHTYFDIKTIAQCKTGDVFPYASLFNDFTNNSDVTMTFTSGDESVIKYEDSKLKALCAGSTSFTVAQAESYKWFGLSQTLNINVKKYDSNFSLTNNGADITCLIGDKIDALSLYTTANNEILPTITSDNPAVVSFNPTTRQLEANTAGEAIITIAQPVDCKWTEYTATRKIIVHKHTPVFTFQKPVYFNDTVVDYFTTSNTQTPLSITSQTDTDVAIVYFDQNNPNDLYTTDLISFIKEDTTFVTFTQEENWYWYARTVIDTIVPINPNNHVTFTLTENNRTVFDKGSYILRGWENQSIQFGDDGGGFNYEDKYLIIEFTGIPDSLSFTTTTDWAATTEIGNNIFFYTQEGKTKDNLSQIWSSTNKENNVKIKLNPDTRWLKICYSGNLKGFFHNVTVTELNEFEAVPNVLDFGLQYVDNPKTTKSFDFKYANAGYKVHLESTDTMFTVATTYIDTIGGEKYGTVHDIQVTYNPLHVHQTTGEDAMILIWDEAGHRDTVFLHVNTVKSKPSLYWTEDWSAHEPIVLLGQHMPDTVAKATNGYPVKYRSDDESILKIAPDSLSFIAVGIGETYITAHADSDRVYLQPDTIRKLFRVTDKLMQYIVWEDNLTHFCIGDQPDTLHAQAWVMTDAATGEWEYSPEQTAKIQYYSSNPDVVEVQGNLLIIKGEGELLLSATINGDTIYEKTSTQVPVRVRDCSVTCSDADLVIPVINANGTVMMPEDKLEYDPYALFQNEHILRIDTSQGIPGHLIFAYYGRQAWGTLEGKIRVWESTDGGENWLQVLSDADAVEPENGVTHYSPLIPLSRNATHLKFERFPELDVKLGYHILQHITVLPDKYIESVPNDIHWGNVYVGNSPDTTIAITYSSIRSNLQIASSQPSHLTINKSTIVDDCGAWDTVPLTISLKADISIVGNYHQYVTVTDPIGGMTDTIHVYANIVKNSPTITWNPTDTIRSSAEWETKKTAISSSGDQVLYEITQGNQLDEFAYLNDAGKMILLRGGWITARAYTAETTTSNEVSAYHDFFIVVDPLFQDFDNDGNWLNDNNWNIGRIPWTTDSATIAANKHVSLDTVIITEGLSFESGGSIHITHEGGLTVGAQGIQGAATDGSSIVIDNLKTGAGFLRISPAYQGTMPRATINYQTRSTLDTGANKDATWQYIGAPGNDVQFTVDGITWLYQWSEPQNWINKTGTLTLEPFAGYAITQYGKPTYALSAEAITSDQTITLTKTESGMNGNNLFANSYMAPIDAKNFTPEDFSDYNTGSEDIVKTFYIFNSGSWNEWNKYDTETSKGSNGNDVPGQYCAVPAFSSKYMDGAEITTLPPMQGIYVIANTNGAHIHLNYEKHVWNAGTNPNISTDMHEPMRTPQRLQAEEQMQQDNFRRIRIQLNSANSGADRLYIIQTDETTPLYDNGYDAPNQTVSGLTNIYTTESFGKMEVSCSNRIDSMYIGFQAGSDMQYTLSFSSLIGDMLYLQDLEQDTIVAMQQDMPYTFSATPLTINDHRFRLLLYPEDYSDTPNTPTDTEQADNIRVWVNNNVLHVIGAPANSTLHIYNISGAHIFTQIISDTPYTYNLSHLSASVYLVRINNYTYKVITK